MIPWWIHEILHNASTLKHKKPNGVISAHNMTWCMSLQLGSPRNAKCSSPLQAGNGFPWLRLAQVNFHMAMGRNSWCHNIWVDEHPFTIIQIYHHLPSILMFTSKTIGSCRFFGSCPWHPGSRTTPQTSQHCWQCLGRLGQSLPGSKGPLGRLATEIMNLSPNHSNLREQNLNLGPNQAHLDGIRHRFQGFVARKLGTTLCTSGKRDHGPQGFSQGQGGRSPFFLVIH